MTTQPHILDALPNLPGQPRDKHGPVFRAPWEAQAFAMALALHERGVFTWPEWAAALAEAIKRAQAAGDPDLGATYYRHWLDALESLVIAKGLADADRLLADARAMLAQYAASDPSRLAAVAEAAELAKDAANRWLDNCFSLRSWMEARFEGRGEEVRAFFEQSGLKEDAEYL